MFIYQKYCKHIQTHTIHTFSMLTIYNDSMHTAAITMLSYSICDYSTTYTSMQIVSIRCMYLNHWVCYTQ